MPRSFWMGCLLLISLTAAGSADVPIRGGGRSDRRPGPPSSTAVKMQVGISEPGQPARLEIPRRLLTTLQAGAVQPAGDTGTGPSGVATVISGLALSLSLVLGGLWFARRSRGLAAAGTLGLVVAAGAAILAGRASANMAPFPLRAPQPPGTMLLPATVTLVDDGEEIRLTLPPDRLASLQAPKKSPAAGAARPAAQQQASPQGSLPVTRK